MIKVSTAPELPYDFEDFGMTEQELHDKHNPTGDGGEHPHYTREEWVNAVNQDATLAGYLAATIYQGFLVAVGAASGVAVCVQTCRYTDCE